MPEDEFKLYRSNNCVCVCVVQVDTSAANSTSEGLMWLRLVQSARDKEEQNLEAYVKNGQLFYRSLRRIEKDEELLVWYGKDLIDLLLLSSSRAPAKSKGESARSLRAKLTIIRDIIIIIRHRADFFFSLRHRVVPPLLSRLQPAVPV